MKKIRRKFSADFKAKVVIETFRVVSYYTLYPVSLYLV